MTGRREKEGNPRSFPGTYSLLEPHLSCDRVSSGFGVSTGSGESRPNLDDVKMLVLSSVYHVNA